MYINTFQSIWNLQYIFLYASCKHTYVHTDVHTHKYTGAHTYKIVAPKVAYLYT